MLSSRQTWGECLRKISYNSRKSLARGEVSDTTLSTLEHLKKLNPSLPIMSLTFHLNTPLVCLSLQVQYLTLLGMELHARTRRDLEPDPEFDPICALFYCLSSDAPLPDVDSTQMKGVIVVDKNHQSCDRGERSFQQSPTEK